MHSPFPQDLRASRLSQLLSAFRTAAEQTVEGRAFIMLRDSTVESPEMPAMLAAGEPITLRTPESDVLVVVPVKAEGPLEGVLCFFPHKEASEAGIERLRDLCREAAPLVARMRENERLAVGNERAASEQAMDGAGCGQIALEAIIQMNAHEVRNLLHELRNPLVAIQGYTRLLLEERAGQLTATQREYLDIVQQNTGRLVHTINAAQEAARLAESERLCVEMFDMRDLCRESVQSVRGVAAEKSVRIVERVPPDPFPIAGDRQKLARASRGLLAWAARAAPAGGELLVELSHTERGDVVMKISDTEGNLAAALASAANGGSAGTPEIESIVRLHGGRIAVRGKPGQSSACILTLPVVLHVEAKEGAHS